ncbi:MAG TPA: acetylornithine transaminase [Jatrophihabitans sp.]|jgi:acetylornithine aminotransferase|uniref:acetylornithine transaminase n=1 Tax=Jatrophihabitans sp. TaxID=1932789 RepID=UPI002F2390AF
MTNRLLAKRWAGVMMDNYGTPRLAIAAGRGVRVSDVEGASYLDFYAGVAVSSLGHAHPAVVAAVSEQVAAVAHTSNLMMHEPGIRLAERLQSLTGDPTARVFFANDGAAANECALKLSRLYGRSMDPGGARLGLVAARGSFHGRTMGALSVTGNPAKREPFEPLPGPVAFVDYGDVQALRAAVDGSVAAVFLEPTLGEGGVVPAPEGYLRAARQICDEAGALLVIDEVQSGIGRTGQWFASIAAGVVPDILTLAKGLGGGLPIGACIGFGKAAGLFIPGAHGSTFGGNPVCCAAALAVLDTIERDDLLRNVQRCGAALEAGLRALDSPLIQHVRGSGLWFGVVLTCDSAAAVEQAAQERGLLVNPVQPNVVRLAPPLIVTESEVQEALQALRGALEAVHADQQADKRADKRADEADSRE